MNKHLSQPPPKFGRPPGHVEHHGPAIITYTRMWRWQEAEEPPVKQGAMRRVHYRLTYVFDRGDAGGCND